VLKLWPVSRAVKRDRAILSTLLFHALRREELCKLKVKDSRLHPGTSALIHDYLDAAGQDTDENGALFRPIRNNRTGRPERAALQDGQHVALRILRPPHFCASLAWDRRFFVFGWLTDRGPAGPTRPRRLSPRGLFP